MHTDQQPTAHDLLIAVLEIPDRLRDLELAQLEALDQAAAAAVRRLPPRLDPAQADDRLDNRLHLLRLCLAYRIQADRQLAAQLQQAQDQARDAGGPETPQDDPQQAPEQTEQERALTLLRAALTLVMRSPDPGRGGPGSPAKLIRPRPTLPGGGVALQPPPADSRGSDDIPF